MTQTHMTFYVSPEGCDEWSGTLGNPTPNRSDGPFASISRAQQEARNVDKTQAGLIHIVFRGGTYCLNQPWLITGHDSGTVSCPVSYEAWPGEHPVISAGITVTGWEETIYGGLRTWVAPAPKTVFHNLWVNGKRRLRPRYPQVSLLRTVGPSPGSLYEGTNEFQVGQENLRHFSCLDDVEMVYFAIWTESRLPIRLIDREKGVVHTRLRSAMNASDLKYSSQYYYDNVVEEFNTPGQWYLNRAENRLYYLPEQEETLENSQVVVPMLTHVLRVAGTKDSPVEYIRFRGLNFQHTEWYRTDETQIFRWDIRKLMPVSERDVRVTTLADDKAADHQAAISCEAALDFVWARRCRLDNCTVSQTGSYGIALGIGCTENQISRCLLADHGGGGIKIGTQQFELANAAGGNTVSDCEIKNCAEVFHSAVGIWIGHAAFNQILHNSIHDISYSGLSVGWVWGYGPSGAFNNLIEDNEIYNIAINGWMHDLAAIYTLGVSPGTIVRHNYVHHIGKDNQVNGVYTDEGSSFIRWENNIIDHADSAYYHHFGKNNVIVNNIFTNYRCGLVRVRDESPDLSIFVERNIFYSDQKEIMLDWESNDGKGKGYVLRNNLYGCQDGALFSGMNFTKWRALGHDTGSLAADPLFIGLEHGDFSLAADSPALALGFKPISLEGIGPRPAIQDETSSLEAADHDTGA